MAYPYLLEPRPYQKDSMKRIFRKKRFLVAGEMGTGKTKIALDFIGIMTEARKLGRTLIIAPLTVVEVVWEPEIEKNWSKELKITYTILRKDSPPTWKNANVVITSYDYARRHVVELMAWAPDLVVLDESHKVKNPYAKQSKMAHKLGNVCTWALCLTGTPIGNRPLDLWSQFKFLVPGLLEPKFNDFKEQYSLRKGPGGYQLHKYKNLPQLAKIIHPYVKSLKKKEYLSLPDKNFIEVPVEIGDKARKLYKSMEKDFVATIRRDVNIVAPIILSKLTKLSQISGGFIHDTENDEDHALHRAKLEVLEGIADQLREEDVKRLVVFARFRWEINEIRKVLAPNWVVYTIDGSVPSDQRKLANTMYNESGGAIICQTATGSLGLNLQAGNYMCFYSLDYSHINFLQAQDRIHRSGQDKPCFYYILLAKGTLDKRIYKILEQKRDVADEIIQLVRNAQDGD